MQRSSSIFPQTFPRGSRLLQRLRRLSVPGAILLALLQRAPALRVALAGEGLLARAPVGAMLRAMFGAVASLGVVDALAGATSASQITVNQVRASSPLTISATAGVAITTLQFGAVADVGTVSPAVWALTGNFPPGLAFGVRGSTRADQVLRGPGQLSVSNPTLSGTPTAEGAYEFILTAWETTVDAPTGGTAPLTVRVNVAPGARSAPAFTAQPQSQSVDVGATVTFAATVTGSPTPTLQWRRNGTDLAGRTGSSLVLAGVQPADAGDYVLVATNSAGSQSSSPATLTVVSAATAPTFGAQPVSQTIAAGSTVVFLAGVGGSPSPTLQWRRNGAPILGATTATLVLSGENAVAGSYTAVATNSAGTATSTPATLTVSATTNFGRLINLSILTTIDSADANFTMGFVVGGAGTSGTQRLLVRAAGPTLGAAPFSIAGVVADPKLELFAGSNPNGANDNWSGTDILTATFVQVGAFPYVGPLSKDAAMVTDIAVRDNSVKVSGVNGATGTVIAELYDATPAASVTPTSRRLINVSVLKPIAAGATLTAGFVLRGDTARTVLVRAIGPALGAVPFNIDGAMSDPQLKLFDGNSAKIAENDNWGGDAQLSATALGVGAFALTDPASKDAVLLITLPPGNYTAQASGVGTSSGFAIVEIYEVP